MKGIVLIGGGGHCSSVLDCIINTGEYDRIEISDVAETVGTYVGQIKINYEDKDLKVLYDEGIKSAFITVGSIKDTSLRKKLYMKAKEIGFQMETIIAQSAVVSSSASLGEGVFVGKTAVINSGAIIDTMAIINTGAIVEHDCHIGEFSHVAVGAVVCGGVKVGKDCLIGANATVIQGVGIVDGSIVAAGSVIKKDINN